MFHIMLAEHPLTICNRYAYTERICRDYMTSTPGPCFSASPEEYAAESAGGVQASPGVPESLAIYRKISEYLLPENILLFHASALALDGKAYLLTAPSGTGKSTHARLWRERFGGRVTMINDDKPLLSFRPEGVFAHGTPWCGKEKLQTNTACRVAGVVILRQAKENSILPLDARQAFPRLLAQAYRPSDTTGLLKVYDLVNVLCHLPVFELGCTISQEAVSLACNALISDSIKD